MLTNQTCNYNPPLAHISAPIPSVVYKTSTNPKSLSKEDFKMSHTQKRTWLKAAVVECRLRLNEPKVLEALVFCTDPINGIGEPCIGTLQEKIKDSGGGVIGYDTVRKILDRLETKGAIKKESRPNKSNVYKLIGYEYKYENLSKLETGSCNSLYDLNSGGNPRDLSSYITYSENVSFFNNSLKQPDYNKTSTHISEQKLKTDQADDEITRVCLAWVLCQQDIEYVRAVMKTKINVRTTKSAFMADMIRRLKNGTWKRIIPLLPIPEWREVEKAKTFESAQPSDSAGFAAFQEMKKMLSNVIRKVT